MRCSPTQLAVLAFANGFTLWHCRAHSVADAGEPGFFDTVGMLLGSGDLILISAPDGGRAMWATIDDGRIRVMPLG
jgi:hypothetical protein